MLNLNEKKNQSTIFTREFTFSYLHCKTKHKHTITPKFQTTRHTDKHNPIFQVLLGQDT